MVDNCITIKVYTDGACSGNPGPGGWASLILIKGTNGKKLRITLKGGERHTTNNRMEIQAVLKALSFINKNIVNEFKAIDLNILSDSAYVVDTVNNNRLAKWESNDWLTAKGTEVANQDLWRKMQILEKAIKSSEGKVLKFIKVKGHSGNKHNEYVDVTAVAECDKYKKLFNNIT
jgi:ribonuclease HI